MKRSLLSLSVAAALFAQLPAHATKPIADPIVPPQAKVAAAADVKAAQPPSPRMLALKAAASDYQELMGPSRFNGDMIAFLDKLAEVQHSEATRAQLMEHFGVERFFTVQRVAAPADKVAYAVTSPAHRFMDPAGNVIDWTPFNASIELDKAGRRMSTSGSLQSFSTGSKEATVTLGELSFSGNQTKTAYVDIWLGKADYRIGKFTVASANGKGNLVMDDMTIHTNVTERARSMNVAFDMRIKAVQVAGQQVENFRFATRLNNVDMKAFEQLSLALSGKDGKRNPAAELDVVKPQLIAFAKSMAARGTSIDIEEFSMGFQGHKASVTGRMSLARMKDADFASPQAFAQKLLARLEVKVPLAMVNAIAGAVTRQQAVAKGQTLSDGAIAQTSQGITDAMVGKVVTAGYGRVESDTLTTVIEFKGGKLTLNNKEVQLPKKPAAPAK